MLALIAGLTAGLAGSDASAAAADGVDAGSEVSELIVTARKREERLRDIPTAATAFSADQLRNMGGVADVQSLVSNVPGVNFANTSNPVTSEVSIRGSGTSRATAAESGVGLYRNGVYIGGGYQGGRTFSKSDFFDVQTISVLRGVQGALYGRNAVGGSINISSARPDPARRSGYAQVGVAKNERREGELVVNQPLTDSLALRVGVDFMRQDKGDFYNPVRKQYFDAQKSDLFRAQLGYEQGPLKANLLAEHSADMLPGLMYQIYIRPGVNATYPKGLIDDKYRMSWNFPNTAKMRTNYFEFVGEYDFGSATVTLTSALRQRHSQNAFDRDASSQEFQDAAIAAGLITRPTDVNLGGLTVGYARIFFNDIHIVGDKIGRFSWLVGAEVYDLDDEADIFLTKTPTGTTAASLSPGTHQEVSNSFRSAAAYASAGYDLTDNLNFTAEGRYTRDHKDLVSQRLDIGTGAPSGAGFSLDDSTKSDNFSYSLTLAYKYDDWLTYAKLGTAYRAGGFNLSQGDPRAPIAIPVSYRDEDTTSFEVGLKGNLTRNVFINAAAYRNNVDNLVVQADNGCFVGSTVCPAQATPFVYNAGTARQYGVEVELTARAEIAGGVALLNAGVSRQGGKIRSGPDKGKTMPQRPDWTGSFNLNYRRPIAENLTGFFNIKGSFRDGGVQEIEQTPPLYGYQIYDARVGVERDGWQAALYMNNFANENYMVFEGPSARRWNLPQTYGAELTYRW
ncbi:MAG: TonB-dependent receptor [Caulobacteraceae bacterium]|nr:TonB-dependent receptor [Caulobacteraceae bacterium]